MLTISQGQLKLIQCGSFWYPNDCYTVSQIHGQAHMHHANSP